jgi:hypothetical protein
MGPATGRWLQQPRRFEVEDFAKHIPAHSNGVEAQGNFFV